MGQKVVLVVEQKDGLLVSLVKMSLKIGYYVMLWPFIVIVRLLENRTQGTLDGLQLRCGSNTPGLANAIRARGVAAPGAQVIESPIAVTAEDSSTRACPGAAACNAAC